jgi:hypothetical protein
MKNIKNTLAAIGMAAVLGVGSVSANTGLLLSDRATTEQQCTVRTPSLITQLSGIIIIGAPQSLSGLLLSDRLTTECDTRDTREDGRNGLLLSD